MSDASSQQGDLALEGAEILQHLQSGWQPAGVSALQHQAARYISVSCGIVRIDVRRPASGLSRLSVL